MPQYSTENDTIDSETLEEKMINLACANVLQDSGLKKEYAQEVFNQVRELKTHAAKTFKAGDVLWELSVFHFANGRCLTETRQPVASKYGNESCRTW